MAVLAADDALASALREQRVLAADWRITARRISDADPVEPGALVIVDFEDTETRSRAVERIRRDGFAGPILVLADADAVEFDAEAIRRPVRLGALLARMQSHSAARQPDGPARIGPYELSAADCALREAETGRLVRLTELELKLLSYLIDAGGALVDREQLLEQVWGYRADADTHTVETHVWRLRQKVETDDPATRFVVTETGGYRLILASQGQPE
ncbi:MAG TPA: winged helix-turn-helix domain-containing protein [Alphaproteobacteria bacterium]|jgi:DNA-binding response OmpR family regulator|nr:winged helix-turn-helix domain-containing protein [Alphaproteobacteria bacterium]